jgi:hypothetical protein
LVRKTLVLNLALNATWATIRALLVNPLVFLVVPVPMSTTRVPFPASIVMLVPTLIKLVALFALTVPRVLTHLFPDPSLVRAVLSVASLPTTAAALVISATLVNTNLLPA